MSELDTLKVHFTHSQTMREKKQYTIYEIEVRSSSTQTWVIYKRYSHFYDFHQLLMKSIEKHNAANHGSSAPIQLAQLPPKRMTRSLAPEFVEKRRAELQEYMTAILETPGLNQNPIILSFLEVPESVRAMLQLQSSSGGASKGDSSSSHSGSDGRSHLISGPQVNYKSHEERKVMELINTLRNHPSRVAAIKSFEDYFFDQRPRLSAELIRLLFQGRSGQDADGGLAQTSGDLRNSRVAARAALNLLIRLLDVEKNKDAHLFLEQFCSIDHSVIRKMKLDQHITQDRGNRLPAFKILAILKEHAILNYNPHANSNSIGVGSLKQPLTPELVADFNCEYLLQDGIAWKEFKQWESRQTGTVTASTKETLSVVNAALPIQELGPRPVLSTIVQECLNQFLEESMNLNTNPSQPQSHLHVWHQLVEWRRIYQYYRLMPPQLQAPGQTLQNLYPWRYVRPCANSFSGAGISSGLSNSAQDDPSNSVVFQFRKIPAANAVVPASSGPSNSAASAGPSPAPEVTQIRVSFLLPYSTATASKYLWNITTRSIWDPKFERGRIVQSFENGQELETVQFTHQSYSSPYKFRDSVLFRCLQSIPSEVYRRDGVKGGENMIMHGYRSVLHSAAPEHKDPTRSNWYSSGVFIIPIDGQVCDVAPAGVNPYHQAGNAPAPGFGSSTTSEACLVTLFYQLDRESVLIYSPDLLGESSEMRTALARLKVAMGAQFGYRTFRQSKWTDWILSQKRAAEEAFQAELSGGSSSFSGGAGGYANQFGGGLSASVGFIGGNGTGGVRAAVGSSAGRK